MVCVEVGVVMGRWVCCFGVKRTVKANKGLSFNFNWSNYDHDELRASNYGID